MTRIQKLKKQRRIARVVVDLDLVGGILLGGTMDSYTVTGLPSDAIFLGASQGIEYYGVNFFYAHESFDKVPEGVMVPQLFPTITRHHMELSQKVES